jgi:hypothetical protein
MFVKQTSQCLGWAPWCALNYSLEPGLPWCSSWDDQMVPWGQLTQLPLSQYQGLLTAKLFIHIVQCGGGIG